MENNNHNAKEYEIRPKTWKYGLACVLVVCLIVSLYVQCRNRQNANADVHNDVNTTISTVEERQRQTSERIRDAQNRLDDVQNNINSVEKSVDRVQQSVGTMQTTIDRMQQSIDNIERRIGNCESIIERNRNVFADIEKAN